MQYDSNILTYERVSKENKKDTKANSINKIFMIKIILFAVSSFFISRVEIIDSMAPFGIAFVIVILNFKFDKKIDVISSISSALGYISIHDELKDFHMYVDMLLFGTESKEFKNSSAGKRYTKKNLDIVVEKGDKDLIVMVEKADERYEIFDDAVHRAMEKHAQRQKYKPVFAVLFCP